MKQPCEIIKIDKYTRKIDMPTLLLMNRSFNIIGKISRYENWNISLVGNGIDEISFEVHKYANGKLCPVWDDIIDLKIVNVDGFGMFEISVDYTDNTESVKSVHGVSLETELAQIGLYEFHVNDDEAADMVITEYSKDNYDSEGNFIPTTFYREILNTDTQEEAEFKRKHSLLHRVLADKAPHWSIGYVTPYIALDEESQPEESSKFQRTYTVDGESIYDFLTGTVAEESNVIFTFNVSRNETTGKFERTINCYSLCDYIDPETGKLVTEIGKDTTVFVSKNKLAKEITISSNKDNVKNCFRIEGGDDVITDMVRAVNMNGSNYIYQFADFQYNDMPKALVKAIKKYNEELSKEADTYYGNGDMDDFINGSLTLHVTSELEAATALSICKNNRIKTNNVDISNYATAQFWYVVTSGNSKELYLSKTAKTPNKTVTVTSAFDTMGIYSRLCVKYDELAYFESSMMPDVSISETTAEEQYNIMKDALTDEDMTVGVSSVNNYNNNLFVGVSNNVEAIANILIDARYKAEVIENSASFDKKEKDNEEEKDEYVWTGNIRITRAADETDYYPKTNEQISACFEVKIDDDELTFTRQKIEKALHKGSMLDIDFDVDNMDDEGIRKYFNKYSLNRLKSFYDGYNSCLSILMQIDANSPARKDMYEKYFNRMRIISNPPTEKNPNPVPGVLDIRQNQVNDINVKITDIAAEQEAFQKKWNFKDYLEKAGEDFYKIFCAYRREDTYTNSNYVSDGLSTSECLEKAKELVEVATKEAKKACVLQRTVSTSLNNLFALPEFEPLYDKFALFNYIRVRTEDEILKLRLIGVDFSGDSVEEIQVTFSEQIESVDGKMSDLQSIIQQASSMATSYPSTALQAKHGNDAKDEITDIYTNGLNAAKAMLTNNDNNEVTITPSGIICKRMDDEGFYGDKQLRITGNIMAFTTDSWRTVEMAIGETTFTDPLDPEGKREINAYGLLAPAIVGKLIAGENMFIGNKKGSVQITSEGITISNGVIKSSDYEKDKYGNETGSIIDLRDGSFSFAGGGLSYNKGNLLLKNGLIQSANYVKDQSGSMINLTDGSFDYAGGKLTYKNGELTVKGNITATNLIAAQNGNIGGWNINKNSIFNYKTDGSFMQLDSNGQTLISYNGTSNTKMLLTNSKISFSKGDTQYCNIYVTKWSDINADGLNFYSNNDNKYLCFGYDKDTSTSGYEPTLVLNYGLNPNGYTQKILLYGSTLISDNLDVYGDLYIQEESLLDIIKETKVDSAKSADEADYVLTSEITTRDPIGTTKTDGEQISVIACRIENGKTEIGIRGRWSNKKNEYELKWFELDKEIK